MRYLPAVLAAMSFLPADATTAHKGEQLEPLPATTLARMQHDARTRLDKAWSRYLRTTSNRAVDGLAAGRWAMTLQAHRLEAPALAAYTVAAKALPDDPRWPFYIGVEHEEQGRLNQAETAYKRSLELAPDRAQSWSRLGRVYYELGRVEDAVQAFSHALKRDDGLAHAHAGLGDLAVLAQRDVQAIEHYQRALALQPEALRLHYRIAQAARRLGNTARAREHLALYGDRDVRLADPWLEAMQLLARDVGEFLAAASAAAGGGNVLRAESLLRKALYVDPDNVDALVTLADAMRLKGRSDEGLAYVDRALEQDPVHAGALVVKGLLLRQAGRDDDAVRTLLAATRVAADDGNTQALVADALFGLGRFARAAALYAKAGASGQYDAAMALRHGIALQATGDCENALVVLAAASARERSTEALIVHGRIAAVCDGTSADERRRVLAALPQDDGDIHRDETRAMLLASLGRWDEAVDLQRHIVASDGGEGASAKWRRRNLERYRDQQGPVAAWPPGHAYASR